MFFEKILAGAFTLMVLFGLIVFIGYLVIELPPYFFPWAALTMAAWIVALRRD